MRSVVAPNMSESVKGKGKDAGFRWFTVFKASADSVKVQKVRDNGVIVYDVDSILESEPAKRHLEALHKRAEKREASAGKK